MRLFSLLAIFLIPSLSFAKDKICLSDHIFKEFKSYGKSLENAVDLALKDAKAHMAIEKFYFDKSPLAPIQVYKKMKVEGCSGIIGFSYLTDLLTLSKVIKSLDIPIFSPYGATLKIKLGKNIKLLQPRQDKIALKIVEFIKDKFPKQNITVVTDLRRINMLEYKSALASILSGRNVRFVDVVKDEMKIDDVLKVRGVVITLTGTNIAADLIQKAHDSVVFVGVETYGSKTSPSLMNLIGKETRKKIYAFRNLSFSARKSDLSEFYEKYKDHYGTLPTMLSIYGYDSARILINELQGKQKDYLGLSGIQYVNGEMKRSNLYSIVSPSNSYELIQSGVLDE